MFGESGTSRTGEVHRYYKCATAKKHKGCKKKTVRKQWQEDLVVNQTMQLVKDDAAMESIIAKVMELQNKENTNIPLYEKQLRDAESGIQNMLNAIQVGILTSSTKERLEQLEETKRELEARIAEEKLAKPKVTEEFIRFWLLRFRKLDMSLKDQRRDEAAAREAGTARCAGRKSSGKNWTSCSGSMPTTTTPLPISWVLDGRHCGECRRNPVQPKPKKRSDLRPPTL